METKRILVTSKFSIREISDINPSFALAKVAIAYAGRNRNYTSISKEVFEKAIPSLFNCPLVGRYDPELDDFGSHDIRIVQTDDGGFEIVNATVPFGVVPESAEFQWIPCMDDDGEVREYLVTDVILWKRQYGYETLVRKGSWSQSMEIGVNSWIVDHDGYMIIENMYFEALCILGTDVEPCFEGASIAVSTYAIKSQFNAMFRDLYESVKALSIHKEGGVEMPREEFIEILNEFNLSVDDINFEITENMTIDDFKNKVSALVVSSFEEADVDSHNDTGIESLEDNCVPTLEEGFETQIEESTEEQIGDKINDSVHEDQEPVENNELVDYEALYNELRNSYDTLLSEVEELRQYRLTRETEDFRTAVDAVLDQFSDLNGIEEFEALRTTAYEMDSVEDVEFHCFAIRGKNVVVKGKQNTKFTKIPVERVQDGPVAPYGGLIEKYAKK